MKFSLPNFTGLTPLIATLYLGSSCQEIVQVNLPGSVPQVVIEGYITDGNGPFTIKISKSQPYFDQNFFSGIKNADVEISESGSKEKLIDKGSGVYVTSKAKGVPGRTYNLDVTVEGGNFSASVQLPPVIKIDTVYFEKGFLEKDSLNAFVQFHDPAGIENYYRLRVLRNGFIATPDYNLINDYYTDGQTMLAPIYRNFAPGDTAVIELYNLDRHTWKYYQGISDIVQQSMGLQSPGNPPSNFSGGALGNFGAWGKSTFKIIVPKPI